MLKKISLIILCGAMTFCLTGCGKEKEYYCDSEEHELRGTTCVIKTIQKAQVEYYCKGSDELRGNKCYDSVWGYAHAAKERYYCVQGTLRVMDCVVESTYDAKTR